MHECCARSITADGRTADCHQPVASNTVSGLPLCYYHNKVVSRLTTPAPSDYAEEHVSMIVAKGAASVLLWHEKFGGETGVRIPTNEDNEQVAV